MNFTSHLSPYIDLRSSASDSMSRRQWQIPETESVILQTSQQESNPSAQSQKIILPVIGASHAEIRRFRIGTKEDLAYYDSLVHHI